MHLLALLITFIAAIAVLGYCIHDLDERLTKSQEMIDVLSLYILAFTASSRETLSEIDVIWKDYLDKHAHLKEMLDRRKQEIEEAKEEED